MHDRIEWTEDVVQTMNRHLADGPKALPPSVVYLRRRVRGKDVAPKVKGYDYPWGFIEEKLSAGDEVLNFRVFVRPELLGLCCVSDLANTVEVELAPTERLSSMGFCEEELDGEDDDSNRRPGELAWLTADTLLQQVPPHSEVPFDSYIGLAPPPVVRYVFHHDYAGALDALLRSRLLGTPADAPEPLPDPVRDEHPLAAAFAQMKVVIVRD